MVRSFLLLKIFMYFALIDMTRTINVGFKVSMTSSSKNSPPKVKKKICDDDMDNCFTQVCRRKYDRYRCARENRSRQLYRLLYSELCSYVGTCKKYRWPWYYDDVDVLTCKKDSNCLYGQRCIKGICWDEFQGKRCLFNFDCDDMYICERRQCRLPAKEKRRRDQSPKLSKQTFTGYLYFSDGDSGMTYTENFKYDCMQDWQCDTGERCRQQKCMPLRQGKRCRYDRECDSAYYCMKRECQLRPRSKKLKSSSRSSCYSDFDCGNPSSYVCKNRRCIRRKCIFEDDDDCHLPYRQGKSCDFVTDCRPEYTCSNNECVLGDWDDRR